MPTTQSPVNVKEQLPYALHREAVTGVDTISAVDKKRGMNMVGYQVAIIEVLPSGGADPTLGLYYWSEAAGLWLQAQTPEVIGPGGVDTPYHRLITTVRQRRIFVAVTAIAAGQVDVRIAGGRPVNESM